MSKRYVPHFIPRRHSSFQALSEMIKRSNQNFSVPIACPSCGSDSVIATDSLEGLIMSFDLSEEEKKAEKRTGLGSSDEYKPGKGGKKIREVICYDCEALFAIEACFTYHILEKKEK